MIPTGWQIHEGRQLIGMSPAELAKAAGVGLAVVVVRAEIAAHIPILGRMNNQHAEVSIGRLLGTSRRSVSLRLQRQRHAAGLSARPD